MKIKENLWIAAGIVSLLTSLLILAGAASAEILINEIMFNPTDAQGGEDTGEWVELFNNGEEAADLSGFRLCGSNLLAGYVERLNGSTEEANGFALESQSFAVITRGGTGTNVYSSMAVDPDSLAFHVSSALCTSGLSNTGETISIENATIPVEQVTYTNGIAAEGFTAERYNFLSQKFAQSEFVDGSPGFISSIFDESPPEGFIGTEKAVINESTTILFNASNSTDDAAIVNFTYSFGDGNITTSSQDTILHHFNRNGTFTIVLTVEDAAGNSNNTPISLTVNDLSPIAAFSASNATPKESQMITFSDISSSANDALTSRLWDFGDGTFNTSANSTRSYPVNGTFTVTLTVNDSDGSSSAVSRIVNVSFENDAPSITPFAVTFDEDGFNDAVDLDAQGTDEEDGSNLTWTAVPSTSNITAVIASGNILNVSGAKNFSGIGSISLTAKDSGNRNATAVINVTINPVNDAPAIQPVANLSITQDKKLVIQLSASDIDGDNLTFSITSTSPFGDLGTLNATSGLFEFTPNASFYRNFPITFTATDPSGLAADTAANIFVFSTLNISSVSIGISAPPTQLLREGQTVQNVPPASILNFSITIKNTGTQNITRLRTQIGTDDLDIDRPDEESTILFPGASQVFFFNIPLPSLIGEGIYTFVADTEGDDDTLSGDERSSDFSFQINITRSTHELLIEDMDFNVNPSKCLNASAVTVEISNIGDRDEVFDINITQPSLRLNFTDEDISLPFNTSAEVSVPFSAANVPSGNYSVEAQLKFNFGLQAKKANATLSIDNCEPALSAALPGITIDEGSSAALSLKDFFTDLNNDTLSFAKVGGQNLSIIILTNGTVTISSPTDFFGSSNVSFTASDSQNTTRSNNITVTVTPVNDAPAISAIPSQTVNQGSPFTFQVAASDVENDTLSFSIDVNDSVSLASLIISQSGLISGFTPSNADAGKVFLVNVTVNDSLNASKASFTLAVSNVNDAPQFNTSASIPDFTIAEDSSASLSLVPFFFDSDGDSLTFISASSNEHIRVSVNQTSGIAAITPDANFSGTGNISFGASDGTSSSNFSNTAVINVTPVNDAPSVQSITSPQRAIAGNVFFLAVNASDIDNDTLSFAANTTLFAVNANGTISFVPSFDDVGLSEAIAVNVSDGNASITKEFILEVINVLSISDEAVSFNNSAFAPIQDNEVIEGIIIGHNLKVRANVTNFLTSALNLGRMNATITDGQSGQSVFAKATVSLGTLPKQSSQTVTLDFGNLPSIPNGAYSLVLEARGENAFGTFEASREFIIAISSEAGQILLSSITAAPSEVACNRAFTLNASVRNSDGFGSSLNASVQASSQQLGLNSVSSFQEIAFGDAKVFSLPLAAPFAAAPGTYAFTIIANTSQGTEARGTQSIVVQPCALQFSPENDPVISHRAQQQFAIADLKDFPVSEILWQLDGINQSQSFNQESFTYLPDNRTGKNFHSIVVRAKDSSGNTLQKNWLLTAASFPIADTLQAAPQLSALNESQLASVNLTLTKANRGSVQFLEPVDLSNIVVLDGKVNFTATGIIAVDTSGSTVALNKPARITLTGLSYTAAPRIFFNNGFTTDPAAFTDDCTNIFCFIQNFTPAPTANGQITFNVTHFSSFFVNASQPQQAQPAPGSPSANAGSDQSVSAGTKVALDGSSSTDADGSISAFSWSQSSGPSVSINNATQAKANFIPAVDGTYIFSLAVTDNSGLTGSDSVTITVGKESRLRITDLDIKVGDKTSKDIKDGETISRKAQPGDKIVFDIEAGNAFASSSNTDIEDIEIEVTIKDADDGDDVDDTIDIEDLEPGDDDSGTVTLTLPTIIDEDTYDVEIIVDGDSDEGSQRDVFNLKLEVEKDKDELLIDRASASPAKVTCDRRPIISFRVVNIGSNDQDDARVVIESPELNILKVFDSLNLEEGDQEDDSALSESFTISIGSAIAPGSYPIKIRAYADNNKLVDDETVTLEVGSCAERQVTPVRESRKDVEVKKLPSSSAKVPSSPASSITFRDSPEYLALLAGGFLVLLVVGLITLMVAVKVLRKKGQVK
ncbi:tandem-95 repeat protein [Candidatus Woesearchaeota archaeon]|nr:tandem-95 repeat protein [Candidatus Woesearchaeota archaeon]